MGEWIFLRDSRERDKEMIQEYLAHQFKEESGDGHFKIEPDEFQS
jgi:hypothetical protein